jgi:hypothetical protein
LGVSLKFQTDKNTAPDSCAHDSRSTPAATSCVHRMPWFSKRACAILLDVLLPVHRRHTDLIADGFHSRLLESRWSWFQVLMPDSQIRCRNVFQTGLTWDNRSHH